MKAGLVKKSSFTYKLLRFIGTNAYYYSRIALLREYLRGRKKDRAAVFIWMPKNAGTSLLSCLDAPKLKSLKEVKYRFAVNGIVTFGHMDYLKLIENGYVKRQFDERAYKFAFVRNPYDRAVSLYFYLKKSGKVQPDDSFLTFCRCLQEKGFEPIGLYNVKGLSQCNPQTRWIEGIEMDFLGKMESIDKDSKLLFQQIGLPNSSIPQLNRTRHAIWKEYYCPESKQIIEEIYKEDFVKFGYPIEDFLQTE